MQLDLGNWGKMEGEAPNSLATAFEFVTLWAGENDNSTIGRLCAGALGIYLDKTRKLPKYNPAKNKPLEYGFTCLDRLLAAGIVPVAIYEAGAICLADMATKIPSEEEVVEVENFTHSAGLAS